jgi:tripartite-type tricarboxylate transporter receptor subunit TctC
VTARAASNEETSMNRFLLALLLGLGSIPAHAQTWPDKPIRFIVSQAAGSGPDISARFIADRLQRALGQSIIVDNKPGGVNIVGTQAAARSAPDGYNFFFATSAPLTLNLFLFKSLPYDPLRDFVPVAMVAKSGFIVVVNSKAPARNLTELIALTKAQPGGLPLAIDGPRFLTGIMAAYMGKVMGTQFVPVAYNNAAQAVQDTVAGVTQATIHPPAVLDAFMKRGDLRPIAVSSGTRYPAYPDVPTLAESFPGFEMVGWFMLLAPTGIPTEIVQRMNREMDKVLKEPEVQKKLSDFSFLTEGARTLPELNQFLRSEIDFWGKVVKTVGLEAE